MGTWEDKLVEEMNAAAAEQAALGARGAEDPLLKAYQETVDRFERAISVVKERTGAPVQTTGDTERHRWTCGQNLVTVRLDRAAAKYFVSADLGRDIVIEEITAIGGQLMDGRLRPTTADELAQRFVTLLFRGP